MLLQRVLQSSVPQAHQALVAALMVAALSDRLAHAVHSPIDRSQSDELNPEAQPLAQAPEAYSLDERQLLTTWLEQQQSATTGDWQHLFKSFALGDYPLFSATPLEPSDTTVYQLALRDAPADILPAWQDPTVSEPAGTDTSWAPGNAYLLDANEDTTTLVAQLNRTQEASRASGGAQNSKAPDSSSEKTSSASPSSSTTQSEESTGASVWQKCKHTNIRRLL